MGAKTSPKTNSLALSETLRNQTGLVALNIAVRIPLQTNLLLAPLGNSSRSQVRFSINDFISSSIAAFHCGQSARACASATELCHRICFVPLLRILH